MKIILLLTLFGAFSLISCQNIHKQEDSVYSWSQTQRSSDLGKTTVDILHENNKQIYGYIDSPVVGVTHQFLDDDDCLFSISDGTGKDILGSGVTVNPHLKNKVDFLDLDMDGDIDWIIYGDRFYGRFKDNRFAPVTVSMIGDEDPLSYLSNKNSEQDAAPNH